MSNKKAGLGGLLGLALIFGACEAVFGDDDSGTMSAEGSTASNTADSATSTSPAPSCYDDNPVYETGGTCQTGGALVTVAAVIDGDTLELADGRRVSLLGVDAAEAKDCAGDGATKFTRSKVGDRQAMLHREPNIDDVNSDGELLAYIQYGDAYFANDLGNDLVLAGWAVPADNGANTQYMETVQSSHDIAQYQPEGIYGPPCGEPRVYGDDNGNGVPDYDEGNAPDVDADILEDDNHVGRNVWGNGRDDIPFFPG